MELLYEAQLLDEVRRILNSIPHERLALQWDVAIEMWMWEGWLSKCRAILVRYEKKAANYLGLIKVACLLLWYRRQHRLSLSG